MKVSITSFAEFNLQVFQLRLGVGVPEVLHISVTLNPFFMVTLVGVRVTVGRTRNKTHTTKHKVYTLINNKVFKEKKVILLISMVILVFYKKIFKVP